MWRLLLRAVPGLNLIFALPAILRTVLSLAMMATVVVTVVMALYALGFDPIGMAYDWLVHLVEQAVKDAVGNAL